MSDRVPPTQKVEPLVRYILRHWPSAREAGHGGDKHLIWRFYDLILSKYKCKLSERQWAVLMKAAAPESVRRVRQRIHEDAEKGGPTHPDYDLLPKDKRRSAHVEEEKWRRWAREGELLSKEKKEEEEEGGECV